MTLILALSRIGGLMALVKLISINIYFLHGFLFERDLSKINKKKEEIQILKADSVGYRAAIQTVASNFSESRDDSKEI